MSRMESQPRAAQWRARLGQVAMVFFRLLDHDLAAEGERRPNLISSANHSSWLADVHQPAFWVPDCLSSILACVGR